MEAPSPLDEDMFERIIDTLEKAHHSALQVLCSGGAVPTGQPLPAADAVLELQTALQARILS